MIRLRLRLLLESKGSLVRKDALFVLPFELDGLPGMGAEAIEASAVAAVAFAAAALADADDPPPLPPPDDAELV
jgi:hypothetical protein